VTQNLVRLDLNSGLLQGENTELDSGKGGGLEPPGPGPFSNHLTLRKILHSTMQYICSNSYLRFAVSATIEILQKLLSTAFSFEA